MALLAQFHGDSGTDEEQIAHGICLERPSHPKLLLCLTSDGGTYKVQCMHWPSYFISDPIAPTPYDGNKFAFMGDVMPGNYIRMVSLPDDAFQVCAERWVPTLAGMPAAIGALGNPHERILAIDANDPNSERVEVRVCIRVPVAYMDLVLNTSYTPKEAWETIGGAVLNDGRAVQCVPLINWLPVACTSRSNAAGYTLPPMNYLGDRLTVLPNLGADDALQAFRWALLVTDLPALNNAPVTPSDQVLAVLQAVKEDNARHAAQRTAERQAAAAPKVPSEEFVDAAPRWMLVCGATNDLGLPELYHQWANCKKAERRPILALRFRDRALQLGAATNISPLAAKELYETILSCELATPIAQQSVLTQGLSPFSCGLFIGSQCSPVQIRAE